MMVCVVAALAQTNGVPPIVPPGTEHTDLSTFWKLAISGVTPLLVGLAKRAVPQIPKLLLPLSTPFLGISIGLLMNWLNVAHLGWVDLGQAGAAAVMVRETWAQAIKCFDKTTPA